MTNLSHIENQYKRDIFKKLNFNFEKGKRILDLGCGDGSDAEIFIKVFRLNTYATDIYKDKNIRNIKGLKFQKSTIFNLPYENNFFDYVFLHDVLHHIDEADQKLENHIKGLMEIKRVAKKKGTVIIIEGNRYNPMFYPHMVLLRGHNHFTQNYFKELVYKVFKNPNFRFFEAHLYPYGFVPIFKLFEIFMEKLSPKKFLSYNVAIVKI